MNVYCIGVVLRAALAPAVSAPGGATQLEKAREEAMKTLEASMVLTGTVDIEADGSVSGYAVDKAGQVPDYVRDIIERQARAWKFEPTVVDGVPVAVRSPMTVRMLARPINDEEMEVVIAGASFGSPEGTRPAPAVERRVRPKYPNGPLYAGIEADVYVVLMVGADGAVLDTAVEQVNLRTLEGGRRAAAMRQELADAAVRGLRAWRFAPMDPDEAAERGYWLARIPVAFHIKRDGPGYGEWAPYFPGERLARPQWHPDSSDESADAMVAGAVQQLGTGPKLLTPVFQG